MHGLVREGDLILGVEVVLNRRGPEEVRIDARFGQSEARLEATEIRLEVGAPCMGCQRGSAPVRRLCEPCK